MSDPITFENASPRFALPFLYAGQAQKEFYVNEAFAITDALLHCAVEGTLDAPPTSPADGLNWRVGAGAAGEWVGQAGKIACRQSGGWLFVSPRDGMQIYDRATGSFCLYASGWRTSSCVDKPVGGSVIDTESRNAVNQIIAVLQSAGILP